MRQKTLTLNPEQLACLASPIRNDVFNNLRSLKRGSVSDVASALGKSPETIHYHVRALEKVGLIEVVAKRRTERRPEAIYASAAERYRLPTAEENPGALELTRKSVVTGLRRVAAGFEAASLASESETELGQSIHVMRLNARLSLKDFAEFTEMLERAAEFATEHESGQGQRLVWSSVVYPVVPSQKT